MTPKPSMVTLSRSITTCMFGVPLLHLYGSFDVMCVFSEDAPLLSPETLLTSTPTPHPIPGAGSDHGHGRVPLQRGCFASRSSRGAGPLSGHEGVKRGGYLPRVLA